MDIVLDLSLRLLAAAGFAALIGYERELRAKGAGIRTHVLLALGAALFMIVSQYGFEGADKFDASRVAAGVVGGLGFLGGGIIMKTKNHVTGLTTAAGLWVTGAIGMACGSAMYVLTGVCVVLTLICLELLNFYSVKLGEKEVSIVLSSADQKALTETLTALKKRTKSFSLSTHDGHYKAELLLRVPKKEYGVDLLSQLNSYPNVKLENLE